MNVLIVEDEMVVACDLEATLQDLGHTVVGIAPDRGTALELAGADVGLALVDNHLRDGETGPQIGEALVAKGVAVIFVTGNPRALGAGIPGAVGVYTKPLDASGVASLLGYAECLTAGTHGSPPPGLVLFDAP